MYFQGMYFQWRIKGAEYKFINSLLSYRINLRFYVFILLSEQYMLI